MCFALGKTIKKRVIVNNKSRYVDTSAQSEEVKNETNNKKREEETVENKV